MAVAWVLFVVVAAGAPDVCELNKQVKVSIGGAWATWPAGTRVEIKSRGKQWAELKSDKGAGRVATAAIEAACPTGLATEAPAAPATPVASPALVALGTPSPATEPAPVLAAPLLVAAPSADLSAAKATATLSADKLVAVLDVKGGKDLDGTARALTTVLAAQIGAEPGLKAVAPSELKALLSHQADASLLGCDSVNCLANVAKMVDAKLIATGTVDFVEGAYLLSLSLIEPAGPSVVSRQEAVWRGSADDLLGLVRPLVQRMVDPHGQAHIGSLEVVAVDGARVVVDGKEVGVAPLSAALTSLPTGAHSVRVESEGFLPYQNDIVVARNETTVARVTLEEISLFERPLFWTALGGSALVATGAVIGITTWALLSQERPTRVELAQKP
jgi:hypothetical protein